ncbi:MAG TPA: glycosyltransferase family 1 protein, partial [Phycisphaerae bacterium]|nr:glycosyltransferase family 1 protein [Phycisphaerae bacterium]
CIDHQTGRLVPTGDAQALRKAIAELASDASLRTQMGAAGQKMAVSRFDSEVMVDKLSQLYERLQSTAPRR